MKGKPSIIESKLLFISLTFEFELNNKQGRPNIFAHIDVLISLQRNIDILRKKSTQTIV